ncbi:MAG: EscU/YscU/HrcU family type III secretion system export apparatus switch protein [Halanaerobiaceae bacterium]
MNNDKNNDDNLKDIMQKKAAALKYDMDKDEAPVVTASGKGTIADKIIEAAAEHDIPVKEDRDIVDILVQLNIGEEIPPELYQAIAEILSFIYRLEDA